MPGTLAAARLGQAWLGVGVSNGVLDLPLEDRRSSAELHRSRGKGSQDYRHPKSAKAKGLRQVFEVIFHNRM